MHASLTQVLALRQANLKDGMPLDMTVYGLTTRRVGSLPDRKKDSLVSLASHLSNLILPHSLDERKTSLVQRTARSLRRQGALFPGSGGCSDSHPVLMARTAPRMTIGLLESLLEAEACRSCCLACSGQPSCRAWRVLVGTMACRSYTTSEFSFEQDKPRVIWGIPSLAVRNGFAGDKLTPPRSRRLSRAPRYDPS